MEDAFSIRPNVPDISHFNVGSQPDWYQACGANTNILQVFWVKSQNKRPSQHSWDGQKVCLCPNKGFKLV